MVSKKLLFLPLIVTIYCGYLFWFSISFRDLILPAISGLLVAIIVVSLNRYFRSKNWQNMIFGVCLILTSFLLPVGAGGVVFSSGIALLTIWPFLGRRENKIMAKVSVENDNQVVSDRGDEVPLKQDKSDGVIFGMSRAGVCEFKDKQLNRHCLIVGASGSGKTVTIGNIVESAVNRKIPVIFVDGKGDSDLHDSVKEYCEAKGVNFKGLSGANDDSSVYNPLSTGDFTSKKDRIIALREWSEDHYRILAEGYLQTAFKVLEAANIDVDIVSLSKNLDYENLIMLAREIDSDDLLEELAKKEDAVKQISSLIAEIDNLAGSAAGELLDCSSGRPIIKMRDVIDNGGVAMFSINSLQFPQFSSTLGKLVINDIKALCGDQLKQKSNKPFYVILDEFSAFAGDQTEKLINMGRGAGAMTILGTQTLADLDDVSPSFAGKIIGSVNTFIVHSLNNSDDAERTASIFGTRRTSELTHQVGEAGATGAGSLRSTRKYFVHPDDIKSLDVGEAYVYSKTDKAEPHLVNIRMSPIN